MDFHSHLASYEIIGFLLGNWDSVSKTISVKMAVPCKGILNEGEDKVTNVELDPESEIATRELALKLGYSVVGW